MCITIKSHSGLATARLVRPLTFFFLTSKLTLLAAEYIPVKKFLDKRQTLRMGEVIAAISKSNRTYEEIINYIIIDNNEEPEKE